jgi:hypothetical protein
MFGKCFVLAVVFDFFRRGLTWRTPVLGIAGVAGTRSLVVAVTVVITAVV